MLGEQRRHLGLEPAERAPLPVGPIRVAAGVRARDDDGNRRPRSCERIHPRDRHAAAARLAHAPARRQRRSTSNSAFACRTAPIAGSARADARCCGPTAGRGAWPGSLTDITDRKADRSAGLRGKGTGASARCASIADAVITVDTSGRVEFLNPVAERLTGWRNEDAHRTSRDDSVLRDGRKHRHRGS